MSFPAERLPAGLARRIALAAQGFAEPRPGGVVGTRQLRRMIERLAVVQIDSVNVLSRSHYLPAFSRLGTIRGPRWTSSRPAGTPSSSTGRTRRRSCPCGCSRTCAGGWRRPRSTPGATWSASRRSGPGTSRRCWTGCAPTGPLKASEIVEPKPDRPGTMWNWHPGKVALEWLFFTGADHRDPPDDQLREGLRPHRAGAAGRRPAGPDTRPGRRRPRAGPHRGAGAGGGDRAGSARLLPAPSRGGPAAVAELADAGELLAGRGARLGRARPGSTRRPGGPGASARGRC